MVVLHLHLLQLQLVELGHTAHPLNNINHVPSVSALLNGEAQILPIIFRIRLSLHISCTLTQHCQLERFCAKSAHPGAPFHLSVEFAVDGQQLHFIGALPSSGFIVCLLHQVIEKIICEGPHLIFDRKPSERCLILRLIGLEFAFSLFLTLSCKF